MSRVVKFVDRLTRGARGKKPEQRFRCDYSADGFATVGKNLGPILDERFAAAYEWSARKPWAGRQQPWGHVDTRWRAHIVVWAATQALKIDGCFVECGVDTAILSGTIAKHLGWEAIRRDFFLFDTFEGIPNVAGMTESEQAARVAYNRDHYSDTFAFVADKMAGYSNVQIVKGTLPETLNAVDGRRIAYLSVDLNNAPSEKAVIERLWQQLSPGAVVVIDDYAWAGHEPQFEMWNAFAAARGLMVAALPTGQGLLIKPHA